MTKMRCTGDFNDPWLECDDCGVSFQLVYNRSVETMHGIQYCPFCGDDVEEVVDELE